MKLILHGDCLEKLKIVEDKTVQVVYLDPPFNSDRNYQMSNVDETGFNDRWENDEEYSKFIESVIKEIKPKIKENGSLFFHISAEEMLIPNIICSKYFKNVQPIFWKKSRSKNNVKSKLGSAIDVIFWCHDSKNKKFNMPYQELDQKYLEGSYNNKDEVGNFALGHLVIDPTRKGSYKYEVTIDGRIFNPIRGWRISKDDLNVLISQNRVYVPKTAKANLYKKIYLHESKGKPCMNLWDDIHSIAQGTETRRYPTAKPEKLLERIITMCSDEGDLILDPMSGSGTTGFIASKLNRNFILIDKNEDAISIANERILQ